MGIATKQHKKVPKLRFPEFTSEWNSRKLGDVAEFWNGKAHEQVIDENGSYVVVNSKFVSSEGVARKYSNQLISELSAGDVVLVMSDIPNGKALGKTYLITENKKYSLNQRIGGIKSTKIISPFLKTIVNRNEYFLTFDNGVSQTNLRKDEVLACPLTFPSLDEQQKIADFLGSVDAWLENLRQQKTTLETYKRGMMQKLFTQQVRFKDDNGKDFPEWQEKKLGALENCGDLKLGRGNVISKRDMVSNPGEYPIYSSSVKDNGLFGKYGSYMFNEELITWSVDGGGHFFYRPEHKFSITNVSGWMRVLNNSMITKFLAYQLQYHHTKLVFDYSSKAHPSVIRGMYTISLPSKKEQQKIADFLTAIDQTITAKAEEITKVEQWKKGLMQKMFV